MGNPNSGIPVQYLPLYNVSNPASIIVGVDILRATHVLTLTVSLAGVSAIETTGSARGVLSDQGGKSPLVPLLASTTAVTVGSADSVTLEVIDLVRTWQVVEGTRPAQAFFLSLQPEASSFTLPVFASTRSPSGAPRLRLTYVYPLGFEEP